MRPETGLYVHIPFCASTCDFCGFYQKKPRGDDFSRYLEGVRQELNGYHRPENLSTVFWGGGTPGLLGPRELEVLGRLTLDFSDESTLREWTVEMAPAFVTRRKLEVLRALGVNRISMGVQSFNPTTLEDLGRQHSREQVMRAVDGVRSSGIENWNMDLIFGSPRQTETEWREDLEQAVDLEPAHISTYCLTYEEDTALYIRLSEGVVERDSDREAFFYQQAWELLENAGYPQYEISNFAHPGFESIHNINTWNMQEWIGIGPSAASQYGGRRYSNIPDLEQWLQSVGTGSPTRIQVMDAGPDLLAQDALIFGIRRNAGVDLDSWAKRFNREDMRDALLPKFREWVDAGLAEPLLPDTLRLTLNGRLLADGLGGEILEWTSPLPAGE